MCLFLILLVLSARVAAVFWWIFEPNRWDAAFDYVIVPILGIVFLPWTTIMWVAVAPRGTASGWDFLWIGMAVVIDIASYGTGGVGGRRYQSYY